MDELYRENAKIVYYFLYKHCNDKQLAEDLMQETFLQAMKSIERYDYSCKISVWLCQIAKHLLYRHQKKLGREILSNETGIYMPASSDVEKEVIDRCELADVLSELDALPEQTREVIRLRCMGDMSFRAIGEMLGKSEVWARVTFYRGKEQLIKKCRK